MNLECLSNSEKGIIAQNPNTPPETLERLAGDLDWFVRRNVAKNSNTSPATLDRLADECPYAVKTNPNTQPETLARLADDNNRGVRCYVARNPNTPPYIREYLDAVRFMELYLINVK